MGLALNTSGVDARSILGRQGSCLPRRITMKLLGLKVLVITALLGTGVCVWSQNCQTRDETPAEIRSAIDNAAKQVYDQAAAGSVSAMQANAIPSLQSSFNGIAAAISDNKAAFAGAKPQLRTSFFIDNATPSSDGRFYC